ncbi:lytic transglycosylase domain-containing protein [Thiohalophilus thiocyanatoxydans]|uniref:Transglycosylase-like protein with SLT domain n=1 Tax=Thiohalophilus thiocyanatoxydans TaxID=381308 RepID=A0A4R8IV45_9GAMM|nr:lytic transglycosylase domain-containing protein [Thiohalophilus thiocyanatoxydans]TDY01617.1 transglycosylase-like protein with SLT domain [Thiohalophilus thiocyanatoxydans]
MLRAVSITRTSALLLVATLLAGPSLAADSGHADPELRQLLQQAINDNDSFEDRFDAEVWLVDMSQRLKSRMPDTRKRLNLLRQIHFEARRADLWPELVLAVIEVESNFDRFAISSAGAMGLMQVMPFWLDEIGQPGDNLFDIQTNLRMGCTILKYYLDKENGNLTPALARYNGSYGSHRYTTKIYTALDNRWRRY